MILNNNFHVSDPMQREATAEVLSYSGIKKKNFFLHKNLFKKFKCCRTAGSQSKILNQFESDAHYRKGVLEVFDNLWVG
jgi:hypothetical protein